MSHQQNSISKKQEQQQSQPGTAKSYNKIVSIQQEIFDTKNEILSTPLNLYLHTFIKALKKQSLLNFFYCCLTLDKIIPSPIFFYKT